MAGESARLITERQEVRPLPRRLPLRSQLNGRLPVSEAGQGGSSPPSAVAVRSDDRFAALICHTLKILRFPTVRLACTASAKSECSIHSRGEKEDGKQGTFQVARGQARPGGGRAQRGARAGLRAHAEAGARSVRGDGLPQRHVLRRRGGAAREGA